VRLEHWWLKLQEEIEALEEMSATPLLCPRGEFFFNRSNPDGISALS
jgi:hypothetical protein